MSKFLVETQQKKLSESQFFISVLYSLSIFLLIKQFFRAENFSLNAENSQISHMSLKNKTKSPEDQNQNQNFEYEIDNDWIKFKITKGNRIKLLYNPNYKDKNKQFDFRTTPFTASKIRELLQIRERLFQLVDLKEKEGLNNQIFEGKPKFKSAKYTFPTPVFAISFDHANELSMNFPKFLKLIENLKLLKPPKQILVYELTKPDQPMKPGALQQYFDDHYNKNYTRREEVKHRHFVPIVVKNLNLDINFRSLPFVSELKKYAFKLIVHTYALLEAKGSILWMDASIGFRDSYLDETNDDDLLAGREIFEKRIIKIFESNEKNQLLGRSLTNRTVPNPILCSYHVIPQAGHNTWDTTCNQMIDFFKTKELYPGSYYSTQAQSGGIIKFLSSPQCVDAIYLPAFICAITEDCMAPMGNKLKCGALAWATGLNKRQNEFRNRIWLEYLKERKNQSDIQVFEKYYPEIPEWQDFPSDFDKNTCRSSCHRYDQSLENLLTGNYHQWNITQFISRYTELGTGDLFGIALREGDSTGFGNALTDKNLKGLLNAEEIMSQN